MTDILLGYEIGSGDPVRVPYAHTIERGWAAATGRPAPKNLDMAKLAEYGFVRIVGTGSYQSVPGMKVNVKEVNAVA